jgi:hypothetical protein
MLMMWLKLWGGLWKMFEWRVLGKMFKWRVSRYIRRGCN